MGIERRRDRRHRFHIVVVVSGGPRDIVTRAEDVSFNGLFVRTDAPLQERHLVRMQLTLPPGGDQLVVTGMVVRCLPPIGGRPPGAGIRFYGLGQEDRDRWSRFIHYVAGRSRSGAQRSSTPANRASAAAAAG